MRKRLRKSIAGILALLMIVTNFQLNGLQVKAEEATTEDKTYTMKEMTQVDAWGVSSEDLEGGGKKLSFAGNWQTVFYSIPEGIDFGNVEKVTFNVVSDNMGSFAYKTLTQEAYDTEGRPHTQVDYGNGVIVPEAATKADIKYLAITSNISNDPEDKTVVEMEISGITFTVKKDTSTEGSSNNPQTEDKVYTMAELTQVATWGVTPEELEGGVEKLTFAGNWQTVFYSIPEGIDFGNVEKVTFNVVSANKGSFAYKTLTQEAYDTEGRPHTQVDYGNGVIVPEGATKADIKYLAITSNISNDPEDKTVVEMEISGVTLTVKKDASSEGGSGDNQPGDDQTGGESGGNSSDTPGTGGSSETVPEVITEVTYNFKDLEKYKSYDMDMTVSDGGEASMTFTKQHGEAYFKLPSGLDASKIKSVKLNVTSGNEGDLSLKLYDEVIEAYKDAIKFTYPGISIEPDAVFAGFGIMGINTNECSVKISGVTFTVADSVENVEIKKTYTFNELVADAGKNPYGGVTTSIDDNGAITLGFTGQFQESFYEIPEEIDASKVHKVTFNVSSGNGDALAYKFYTVDNYGGDWPKTPDEQVAYCNPVAVITSGFAGMTNFGIMSMNNAEYSAVVDSVTFHTTGWGYSDVVEDDSNNNGNTGSNDLTFTADEVSIQWGSATYEQVEGKINMTFANEYDQIKIQLPQSINMSNCESVEYVLADQTVPVTLKLWNGGDELWSKTDCSGAEKYVVVPGISDTIDIVGIMYAGETVPADAKASFISVTFKMKEGAPDIVLGDNIIINGNFDNSDLSMWDIAQGNSVISAEIAENAIFDDVKTYGKISRDPASSSTQDCFSQEITDVVEYGAEYQYEFYAMLSDEYEGAPDNQRIVDFAPYSYEEDDKDNEYGGNTYYGSYSGGILSGTISQTLTPGEWTKFSGTFTIPKGVERVVIRIIEQGTNYGSGDCVKGDYYITGVSMKKIDKPIPEIEQDIPNWKDSLVKDLGADTIAGTSLTEGEMSDDVLMELVTKHFNAVTPGNELKLDAMLNYSNDKCPENGTQIVMFNGEELEVPILNHSRANAILDELLEWNAANPDKQIKARGHVLVWHSQAPTWFFKENYDIDADYVSKDVMDKRLEWYIKTMLEYYTGSNSKYKGLFYGWDVVNEAINDGTNTYRGADESDWAAVYGHQSNEYIIKAFQYANKYAPANLELYYNDYNDCVPGKVQGIVKLLKDVLAAEGTRIDAMGMQAHHNMSTPSVEEVEAAVRAYCEVVGKVQWTELDIKASSSYDGTDATREEEFNKMAYRYKDYYDVLKKLDAEDGIDVAGITMWGVVDKNSWLHQQAGVGGGADGKQKQCPLLFDDNYKAKPSFWAFVDPSKLPARIPEIQKIVISAYKDDNYSQGMEYSMAQGDAEATFVPMWDENGLKVLVTVQDATVDATDAVTVYVDPAMKAGETTPIAVTVKRADAQAIDGGYSAEITVALSSTGIAKKVSMDVVVVNGTESMAFNDTTLTQETSSKYYSTATMKPIATIDQGTITIDGEADDKWTEVEEIPLTINLGAKVESNIKMLWDNDYLYILAEVTDAELNKDNASEWLQDSIEVFIDENNKKTSSYDADDKQYRINYVNDQSFGSQKWEAEDVKSVSKITADGYVIEAAFKWTDITPQNGTKIGLELQINDASKDADKGNPGRLGTLSWADDTGMGYAGSDVFGIVILVADEEVEPKPETKPEPDSETLKEMVEDLSVLVDENATKEEKIQAVKDIITEVQELVAAGKLNEVLEANVEYMEDLFEKAIGRVLDVVNVENKVPQIVDIVGALIGIDLDKEAKMVFETVAAPSLDAKYKNAFAFDAKLFASDAAVQPLVPVTIRMALPPSIDKTKEVVVLHFADGSTTPEILASKVMGNMIEFTTFSFSTFVIVNEGEQQNNNNSGNNAGNNAPAATPAPAPSTDSGVKAPSTGDSAYPMVAVAVLLLTGSAVIIMAGKRKKEEE